MANPVFDVCVIGSGPGGGIATYALASAGLKVALVESGPRLRAGIDYNAHAPVYEHLEARLKQGWGPVSSVSRDFGSTDHFVPVGDRSGHGLLRALGGRSLCWAGHSLRFGPLDFKRWPISYEEVAPFYSKAERLMAVYGSRDGLSNLPDGEFQKPVALRCAEQLLKGGVEKLKKRGRRMEFVGQRKAMPTETRPGQRATCHYCGNCMKGCEVDAKYTSANTPIPRALATGNLTMFLESMMTRIITRDGRVRSVAYVSHGEEREIQCKNLVLACSAIETARLLLHNGLSNSSGLVGKNLMSHFGVTVTALFPQLRDRDASRDAGTDYFHGLLTGLYWDQPSRDFEGTYQVQVGSGVPPRNLPIRNAPGFGESFKRDLREMNVMHASMGMQGMMLPSPGTFTDLDPRRKDRFGIPLPRVHLHYGENEIAMARDMVGTCGEIISAAGGQVYLQPSTISPDTLALDNNHYAGTARMGRDPRTSVVDLDGCSHDVRNLWIGDSSVFPAYPEKNPTLTNVALSWRMSERLAERLRKGGA